MIEEARGNSLPPFLLTDKMQKPALLQKPAREQGRNVNVERFARTHVQGFGKNLKCER